MAKQVQYQELADLDGFRQIVAIIRQEYAQFVQESKGLNAELLRSMQQVTSELKAIRGQAAGSDDGTHLQQYAQRAAGLSEQLKNQRAATEGLAQAEKLHGAVVDSLATRLEKLITEYAQVEGSSAKVIATKKRLAREMADLSTQLDKVGKSSRTTSENTKEVTGTYNKLQKELADARKELKSLDNAFDKGTGKLNQYNARAVELSKTIGRADGALKKIDAGLGQFGRNVGNYPKDKGIGGLLTMLSGLGVATGIGAIVGGLVSIGKEIVAVGAKYEDLDNLLTNSLRNNKAAAKEAGDLIKSFAATSPLEIDEVTGAFTRLVGIGIVPTKQQLIQLSDIALSKNKTITDYVEAIADAQRGEFERLKEFGIDAQKQGDKVIFTYNGVRKSIDNSDRAISDFLISIGKLPGVVGATEKAAQAFNGRWSTFKDNLKGIASDIFQVLLPALNALLSLLNKGIGYVGTFTSGLAQMVQQDGFLATLGKFGSTPGLAVGEAMGRGSAAAAPKPPGGSDSALDAYRKEVEAENRRNEAIRKREETAAKAEKDRDKRRRDAEKQLSDSLNRTRAETEKQLSALEFAFNQGLLTESDYIFQRAQIQQAGVHAEQKLYKQYGKQKEADYIQTETRLNEIAAEYNEKRRKLEDEAFKRAVSSVRDAIEADTNGAKSLLTERLEEIESAYETEQAAIQLTVAQRQITEEEGERRLYDLKLRYLEDTARATVASSDTIVQLATQRLAKLETQLRAEGRSELEIAQALADERKRIEKERTDVEKQASKDRIKQSKAESAEKLRQAELLKQQQQELEQKRWEIAGAAVNAYFDVTSSLRQADLERLDKQKEYELKSAGDNAEARANIEQRYNERTKEIRRKQAMAEKAQAAFSIVLSTAQAIVKTLAVAGPLSIPLSVAIGALGAIQLATVLARPIPEYRTGKGAGDHYEGPAWVGEAGYELIESKQNGKPRYRLAAEKQIAYLNRHDRVYTHQETKRILRVNTELASEVRAAPGGSQYSPPVVVGPSKSDLTTAFKEAIADLPVEQTIVTEDGLKRYTKKNNQRTEWLNGYFSLPRQ